MDTPSAARQASEPQFEWLRTFLNGFIRQMLTSCLALIVSFGLAFLLTPWARSLARRVGLVDRPDGGRKTQREAIPVGGGLVVLGSVILTLIAVWLVIPWDMATSTVGELWLPGLLIAAVSICLLGLADDFGRLRGRHKLLGQLVVVGIVIASGVVVERIECFGLSVEMGLLAIPFTACMLLGAINSLNLIDGMDGLLCCVGAIICLSLAAMAALGGRWETAVVTLALAGALLGFLRYNFPPASIYLGDAGSMLIGLVIGVLAIRSSLKGPATFALTAPTALLAIPLFDTAAAILRRKLTGRSIYTTDRGHLHHCLLRLGWGTRRTLFLIACFCIMTALGALGSMALKNEMLAVVSAVTVIGILVAGRLFGHGELRLLVKRVSAIGSSLMHFPIQGQGRGYEVHLQGNILWCELWSDLQAQCDELGLQRLQLDVNLPALHENYHANWNQTGDSTSSIEEKWRAEIPLSVRGRVFGRIAVTGQRDERPIWQKIATLSRVSEEFADAHHLFNGVNGDRAHANGVAGPHRNGAMSSTAAAETEVETLALRDSALTSPVGAGERLVHE
jgi:UDP-GlcNAc:undecaprenyl-phosphate GlcNAc-1-phosphate transferase